MKLTQPQRNLLLWAQGRGAFCAREAKGALALRAMPSVTICCLIGVGLLEWRGEGMDEWRQDVPYLIYKSDLFRMTDRDREVAEGIGGEPG
ncbi:hypothetical protein HQ590_08630 [bacterium]|nr:hypothetical protein [bacterium]